MKKDQILNNSKQKKNNKLDKSIEHSKKEILFKMILDPYYKVHTKKIEVYNLFKKGYTHKEISQMLNISEQVSKNYKAEVQKKIESILFNLNNIHN